MVAPVVATLASMGLNMLASTVEAKGKQFVEEKLGVELDRMEPDELRQLELDKEDQLREYLLESQRLDNENTASARDMNVKVQTSKETSQLAKNTAYLLDFIIVLAAVSLTGVLVFQAVPAENSELFYMAAGALWAQVVTIVNFHRGSSQGSRDKDSLKGMGR